MTAPKIRFVVIHHVSKMDVNGNRYWLAEVHSTITAESIIFPSSHSSNTRDMLRSAGVDYSEYLEIEKTHPIHVFNRIGRRTEFVNYPTTEKTISLIQGIEVAA